MRRAKLVLECCKYRRTWRWTSGGALHMSGTMLALMVSLSDSARQFSFPSPSSCMHREMRSKTTRVTHDQTRCKQ